MRSPEMKKIVLALMVLSSLVFSGDKIQITNPGFICSEKNPKLLAYTIVLTLAIEQGNEAVEKVLSHVKKETNEDCSLVSPSTNPTFEVIKKQKDQVKDQPMEYIYMKALTVNGEDYSSGNIKMWTISFPNAPSYKKIN